MSDRVIDPRKRLQIGEWLVDGTANELCRGGHSTRVERKVMEVLLALAARDGEVVSREALLDAVWPGVVVGDEVLTQSIIKLRKALDDPARAPAYIETIPKRGYRLIATVTRVDAALGADALDAAPRPEPVSETAPAAGHEPAFMPPPVPTRRRALGVPARAVAAVALTLAVAVVIRVAETRPQSSSAEAGAADAFDREKEAGIVSVTVLPFETIGSGAGQDYLARGISSDLKTDLSRLSGLRVVDLAAGAGNEHAARAVGYVVSGSVERVDATLRINVRLEDAHAHQELWSQRLERPYGDLLNIQNEISSALVAQLPGRISDAEREQLAKRYTNSAAAYEDFLHAKALFLARRPQDNDQARTYYEAAIAEDPQFARAYAGLAMTYAMDYRYQRPGSPASALVRAENLAESARQIDPNLPEVYWALGFIDVQSRNFEAAITALQTAIRLNRSYSDAYALLAGIYTYTGEAGRSIPMLRSALRLRPEGGSLYFLLLGRAYLFENDLQQALINLREAARRNPEDIETHIYLAATLVGAGDHSAAQLEADEVRARQPDFSMRAWLETYPLSSVSYRQRLLRLTATVLS